MEYQGLLVSLAFSANTAWFALIAAFVLLILCSNPDNLEPGNKCRSKSCFVRYCTHGLDQIKVCVKLSLSYAIFTNSVWSANYFGYWGMEVGAVRG